MWARSGSDMSPSPEASYSPTASCSKAMWAEVTLLIAATLRAMISSAEGLPLPGVARGMAVPVGTQGSTTTVTAAVGTPRGLVSRRTMLNIPAPRQLSMERTSAATPTPSSMAKRMRRRRAIRAAATRAPAPTTAEHEPRPSNANSSIIASSSLALHPTDGRRAVPRSAHPRLPDDTQLNQLSGEQVYFRLEVRTKHRPRRNSDNVLGVATARAAKCELYRASDGRAHPARRSPWRIPRPATIRERPANSLAGITCPLFCRRQHHRRSPIALSLQR